MLDWGRAAVCLAIEGRSVADLEWLLGGAADPLTRPTSSAPPLVGQPQIFLEVRYELELAMIEENQEIFDQFGDLGR